MLKRLERQPTRLEPPFPGFCKGCGAVVLNWNPSRTPEDIAQLPEDISGCHKPGRCLPAPSGHGAVLTTVLGHRRCPSPPNHSTRVRETGDVSPELVRLKGWSTEKDAEQSLMSATGLIKHSAISLGELESLDKASIIRQVLLNHQ